MHRKDVDRSTHISTRSTLTPHGSVASSRLACAHSQLYSSSQTIYRRSSSSDRHSTTQLDSRRADGGRGTTPSERALPLPQPFIRPPNKGRLFNRRSAISRQTGTERLQPRVPDDWIQSKSQFDTGHQRGSGPCAISVHVTPRYGNLHGAYSAGWPCRNALTIQRYELLAVGTDGNLTYCPEFLAISPRAENYPRKSYISREPLGPRETQGFRELVIGLGQCGVNQGVVINLAMPETSSRYLFCYIINKHVTITSI